MRKRRIAAFQTIAERDAGKGAVQRVDARKISRRGRVTHHAEEVDVARRGLEVAHREGAADVEALDLPVEASDHGVCETCEHAADLHRKIGGKTMAAQSLPDHLNIRRGDPSPWRQPLDG